MLRIQSFLPLSPRRRFTAMFSFLKYSNSFSSPFLNFSPRNSLKVELFGVKNHKGNKLCSRSCCCWSFSANVNGYLCWSPTLCSSLLNVSIKRAVLFLRVILTRIAQRKIYVENIATSFSLIITGWHHHIFITGCTTVTMAAWPTSTTTWAVRLASCARSLLGLFMTPASSGYSR